MTALPPSPSQTSTSTPRHSNHLWHHRTLSNHLALPPPSATHRMYSWHPQTSTATASPPPRTKSAVVDKSIWFDNFGSLQQHNAMPAAAPEEAISANSIWPNDEVHNVEEESHSHRLTNNKSATHSSSSAESIPSRSMSNQPKTVSKRPPTAAATPPRGVASWACFFPGMYNSDYPRPK